MMSELTEFNQSGKFLLYFPFILVLNVLSFTTFDME